MSGAAILVLLFFFLTLVVGIVAGGKMTSLRDYAVAGTKRSVPVLMFTILASAIGGGSTMGATGEVYRDGIGVLLLFLSLAGGTLVISKFAAPNFDRRFKGMISMGDIIEKFYGGKIESVSAFILCAGSILAVGIQFIALGCILESLLGMDYNVSIMISAFVVGVYSASGGVKAVIATDIMQLIAILVVFVVIAVIACMNVGGLGGIIPEVKVYSEVALKENIYSGVFHLLPIALLTPEFIQRYLMARNPRQISEMLNKTAIVFVIFGFIILITGLSARKLIPGLDDIDSVLPTLITYLFKGDVILFSLGAMAIISAILSNSDSLLNSCSVLVAGRLKKVNDKINALMYVRVITILFTIMAAAFALTRAPVLATSIALASVDCMVTLVTFFAIMRMDVAARDFWVSLAFAMVAIILGKIFLTPRRLPLLCAGVATIAFFTSHFIRNGYKFVWETVDGDRKTSIDKIENTAGATILWLIAKQIERMIINILVFFRDLPKNIMLLLIRMLKACLRRR